MSHRRFPFSVTAVAIAAIGCAILLCASCGSSNSSAISNAQAQAISQEFVSAVQSAMTNSLTPASQPANVHSSLSSLIREVRPETSSSCIPTSNGQTCNFPISYTGPCPSGGTIGVAGDFNLTLDSSGDGSDSSTLTVTPVNCVVSNLTINGDPNVTLSTMLSFTNDGLNFPVTMNESGGISYGPHPSGSCTTKMSITIGATSCSVNGNICGHSVGGSC